MGTAGQTTTSPHPLRHRAVILGLCAVALVGGCSAPLPDHYRPTAGDRAAFRAELRATGSTVLTRGGDLGMDNSGRDVCVLLNRSNGNAGAVRRKARKVGASAAEAQLLVHAAARWLCPFWLGRA